MFCLLAVLGAWSHSTARADVAACESALARPAVHWQFPPDAVATARLDEVLADAGRLLVGPGHDLRPRRITVRVDANIGSHDGMFFAHKMKLVLPLGTDETWWRVRAVWTHEYAHAVIADVLRARGGIWTRYFEFIANDPDPRWTWYRPEFQRLSRLLAVYDECFADLLAMLAARSPVVVNRFARLDELVRLTDLPESIWREESHYALMHVTRDLYRRFERMPAEVWPARVHGVVGALVAVVEGHAARGDRAVTAARAATLFGAEVERRWR